MGDVMSYPFYGLHSVFVGFLGYPMEVIYSSIYNILVVFSLDPILILNSQDFVVGSSGNGCSMKKQPSDLGLLSP
jgi:hypothetical protein